MTPSDMRVLYYLLLVRLRGVGVLEADQGALWLVARDAAAVWWDDVNEQ